MNFSNDLKNNLDSVKKLLPAEDILTYSFQTLDGVACAIVYADGMVNKQLLGELVAKPLANLDLIGTLEKNTPPTAQPSAEQTASSALPSVENSPQKQENSAQTQASYTQAQADYARTQSHFSQPQTQRSYAQAQESALQKQENSSQTQERSTQQQENHLQTQDGATEKGYNANTVKTLIAETLLFPEIKDVPTLTKLSAEVLDGNSVLLVDGIAASWSIGAKLLPVRSISEPPSDVAIKGPREGFIEDIKTNMVLVRKRLKTPNLKFEMQTVGKQSETRVAICYLEGISNEKVKDEIVKRIQQIHLDCVVDSSYIAALLSQRKHSVFKQVGSTEKPDVFSAKIAEGRVGILVDGSPIALTLPFLLTEDLQSSEDYFISPFMATTYRGLRLLALFASLLLPALYVTAQLFKMQLLPLGLMLTIAGSVQGLPLSPSMEIFVVLLLLEILREASIRMPKYVGMSLSVVGALVLGEAAVSAGFLSTPAIIVVAISGICLYTVPNFVETGSILRWLFLLVAGSVGAFGVVILAAFLLYYLVDAESYGAPLLAPFSPLIKKDLRDSVVKYSMTSLTKRPSVLNSKNKTRFRPKKAQKSA